MLNRKTIAAQTNDCFLGKNSEYKLDTSNTLQQYSSDIFIAYKVKSINNANTDLYSVISKHVAMFDIERIKKFLEFPSGNCLSKLLDFGIININKTEHLYLLFQLPPEKNSPKPQIFEGQFLLQKVIIPILETLVQMHAEDLVHGCINNDNVWFNDSGEVVLSNTAAGPCGYSQNLLFEPIKRMLVHRAAKSPSDKTADCYAVGVLLLSMLSGEKKTSSGYEKLMLSKARLGSYNALIRDWFPDQKLDDSVRCLAYWLLHDDSELRWTAEQALKFLRKRHRASTVKNASRLVHADIEQRHNAMLSAPLSFAGNNIYSKSEAAVLAIRQYDEVKLRVRNGALIKDLLANKSVSPEFITKVSLLRARAANFNSQNFKKDELFSSLFIVLLDQQMPLRLKDITFEPSAIFQLYAYAKTKDSKHIINTIKIIYEILPFIYENISSYKLPFDQSILSSFSIDFIDGYIYPEKLYSNQLLSNKIFFTNGEILEEIESLGEDDLDLLIGDKQFVEFILGRVARKKKISWHRNVIFDTVNDQFAKALLAFSLIQRDENIKALKKIAGYFYEKLSESHMNGIKNIAVRDKVSSALKSASEKGDLYSMVIAMQSPEIEDQQRELLQVHDNISKLDAEIDIYKKDMRNFGKWSAIGEDLAVRFAAMAFIATLLFTFYNLV